MAIESFRQRWEVYRPSKAALFWSCVGCVAVALIIGFTWGGWVTGGTAAEMADKAARQARTELVATVCVHRFMNARDASAQLAALKKASIWQRDAIIEEGGWVTLPGVDTSIASAADLCAERLAAMNVPQNGLGAQTNKSGGSVQ